MKIYRIVNSIFADKLIASGKPARWNSKGIEMLYFAQSLSLACLENAVHMSSIDIDNDFFRKVTVDAPDNYKEIREKDLPDGWNSIGLEGHLLCRPFGDKWVRNNSSVLLKVPSVIVPDEFNFLVNPNHPDFSKLKIIEVSSFRFDKRIK